MCRLQSGSNYTTYMYTSIHIGGMLKYCLGRQQFRSFIHRAMIKMINDKNEMHNRQVAILKGMNSSNSPPTN